MDRLILWDIDYTLLYAGGLGRALYAEAFATVIGRPAEHLPTIVGHTDHGLVRDMLRVHGIPADATLIERFYAALSEATHRVSAEIRSRGRVMPGAAEALTALAAVPGTVQSLVTGNLRDTARLKVTTFGLDRHLDLDIGGYGCEHAARAALVCAAHRRAVAKYGVPLPAAQVWVIGDTPDDVAGARGAGCRAVAVGTGPAGADGIARAGADLYLPSLLDVQTLLSVVCGPGATTG